MSRVANALMVLFVLLVLAIGGSEAQTHFTANLTAAQETHTATPDTATGTGTFVLGAEGLEFRITVEGLSGPITAAHFHRGPAGADGKVVRPITEFDGNTAAGTWTFAEGLDTLLTDLLTGNLYVNIHTEANGAGEIRGQVHLSSGDGYTATLSADQETHTVDPDTATGTASFTLTDEGLVFRVTAEGLSGPITAAHFHNGPAGSDGGVVRPITEFDGNTAVGLWRFDEGLDTLLSELKAGNIYVNLHTQKNGPGEIRGQVLPVNSTGFTALLTAAQESHTVDPDTATGTAALVLTDMGLKYDITVEGLSGPITAAHFHGGALGQDGGVAHTITDAFDGNTASGMWALTDGLDAFLADLLTGKLYLNVHTEANGAGEIRGQVLLSSGVGFTAGLTADQETHTVDPDTATGTGSFTLTDAGLAFHVTAEGLSGPITNAHFHRAPAGSDGSVVHGIKDEFDGNTAAGLWTPAEGLDTLLTDLLDGNLYVNLHTAKNGPGEIRGQVIRRSFVTSVEEPGDVVEVPRAFTLLQNYPNPFNPSTTIRFRLERPGRTTLKIYNMLGQEVATLVEQNLAEGSYTITFEARNLPSGVYLYKLESGTQSEARKMILLK